MPPRLGIFGFGPIQYHTPLYQLLAKRAHVDLHVLYLSDKGLRPTLDPEFGISVAWDIDLLSGYKHSFLSTADSPASTAARLLQLARWIPSLDAVVLHGYSSPWMITAMGLCRAFRVPFLLRGDSQPQGGSSGNRRHVRNLAARLAVAASAGGLSIGQLNEEFYRRHGARRTVFAPFSVDDERFATTPAVSRGEVLRRLQLSEGRPVIMFCGKLVQRKRPLDLVEAISGLTVPVSVLFAGEGPLGDSVRSSLGPGEGAITGFVNQLELPSYYHAADILVLPSDLEKWGLVVNEAMAAGVLPIVSDQVGSGPDLAEGIGEIYPCGDIPLLTAALERALTRITDPGCRDQVRSHVSKFSLEKTAAGFEEAALAVTAAGGRPASPPGPR